MTDSVLFPPNNHRLTDTMICGVVQRVQRQFHVATSDTDNSNGMGLNYTSSSTLKRRIHAAEIDCSPEDSSPDTETGSTKTKSMLTPPGKDKIERQDSGTKPWDIEHHRQRRRVYQQRYRKKLDGRTTQFEKDIRLLQEQIRQLERRRLLVLSGLPTSITPWQVVTEYSSIFRFGLKPSVDTQKKFLERALSPDVVTKSGYGVKSLLADWEALRTCYEDLELKLERIEHEREDIILAFQTGYTTITKQTLRNGFPHLIDGDVLTPIAMKLLGRRLVVSTVGRFEWDASRGRIVRIHYAPDLVTALLKLLGNLEDVACVLHDPRIIHQ